MEFAYVPLKSHHVSPLSQRTDAFVGSPLVASRIAPSTAICGSCSSVTWRGTSQLCRLTTAKRGRTCARCACRLRACLLSLQPAASRCVRIPIHDRLRGLQSPQVMSNIIADDVRCAFSNLQSLVSSVQSRQRRLKPLEQPLDQSAEEILVREILHNFSAPGREAQIDPVPDANCFCFRSGADESSGSFHQAGPFRGDPRRSVLDSAGRQRAVAARGETDARYRAVNILQSSPLLPSQRCENHTGAHDPLFVCR